MSDLRFYWLVIAPAGLIGFQAVCWIVLWATRHRGTHSAAQHPEITQYSLRLDT
jgi:hypothetical protein